MHGFMRLLQRARAPELSVERFTMEVGGARTLDILRRNGIVVRAAPATSWACGDVERHTCPRQIERNPLAGGKAFMAICPASPRRCLSVLLDEQDLEMLTTSTSGITDLLRRLLGIVPGARMDGMGMLGYPAVPLGTLGLPGQQRDVFLALEPLDPAFFAFLADRRGTRLRSLVLVPSAWRLPVGVLDQHGPLAHVEIVRLDALLVIRDGDIVLAAPVEAALAPPFSSELHPFCQLYTAGVLRTIDEATRGAVVAAMNQELVLDLTEKTEIGYQALCRRDERIFRAGLTRNDIFVVGEVMVAGRPIRSDRLRWTDIRHPVSVFRRARNKIYEQLGPRWPRLFNTKTISSSDGAEVMELSFRVPAEFRFAVLLPLSMPAVR